MNINFDPSNIADNEQILDSLPSTWFEAEITFQQICRCFKSGKQEIRIACGFFTVKGWGKIRKYTTGKRVYLLVGIDEPGEERARTALVKEILRDLATGVDRNRRQAVQDLVNKMESDQLRVFDARALKHHAKLYLVDRDIAIVSSANTTYRGFVEQIEAGGIYGPPLIERFIQEHASDDTLIVNPEIIAALHRFIQVQVTHYIDKFDEYFARSLDITQELLEAFQHWLMFVSPWSVYLKTMLVLENLQPLKSNYNKQPVSYQLDMIGRTLSHLREHNGSMLVASTGLGKTVVAVHVALRLRESDEIDNVMVIGPKAVRPIWKRELRDASLPCEYFIPQALDKKDASQDRSLVEFEEIVNDTSKKRWLLIIDESHEFRNRFVDKLSNRRYRNSQKVERRSFARLTYFSRRQNLKVLLLTGSPYAKDIDNINNQLHLLPYLEQTSSEVEGVSAKHWFINDVADFRNLAVASQLTTPHVAKYYGQRDGQEIYINRGQERLYIPKVILNSLYIPVTLEPELVPIITAGYFELDSSDPIHRKVIENQVISDWASSPWALRHTIRRVMDTPGGANAYEMKKLEFKFLCQDRQNVLAPLLELLKERSFANDLKIKALLKILAKHRAKKEKIAIYTKRWATAAYLERAISRLMPELCIANTIARLGPGTYDTKKPEHIQELIRKFAPIANNVVVNEEEQYDIFISTDAYGVGVNLQDASVVINYDIDWTPISSVQRAGRILRFWFEPRTVEVYTFVSILTDESNSECELPGIERKWQNLIKRHDESQKIIDLPVLSVEQTLEIDLPDMASPVTIQIESGQLDLEALADEEVSPFFQHKAKLQSNREYAKSIPNDITSAKTYPGKHPLVFVLFNYEDKYEWLLYNCGTQQSSKPDIVHIFNLIACSEETETALIEFSYIEDLSDTCLRDWCEQRSINSEEIVRQCTLYLKPDSEADTFKNWLNN